jgi:hypothetical protein
MQHLGFGQLFNTDDVKHISSGLLESEGLCKLEIGNKTLICFYESMKLLQGPAQEVQTKHLANSFTNYYNHFCGCLSNIQLPLKPDWILYTA